MFQFPRVKLASTSGEEVGKNHLNERTVSTLNLLLGGTALIHVLMLHQMILERVQLSCSGIQTHDPRISC